MPEAWPAEAQVRAGVGAHDRDLQGRVGALRGRARVAQVQAQARLRRQSHHAAKGKEDKQEQMEPGVQAQGMKIGRQFRKNVGSGVQEDGGHFLVIGGMVLPT